MKEIYYRTSKGERIDLIGSPYRMLTETDLFDYEWEAVTQGTNLPLIVKMKKNLVSPSFSIRVIGRSKSDFLDNVEALIGKFDGDVYRGEMGRLYVGEYYRPCFIQSAGMQKVWEKTSTVIEFTAISDEADWVKWEKLSYEGAGMAYSGAVPYTIVPSNNSSGLHITSNHDHTYGIEWQNQQPNGYIQFYLSEVMTLNSINGIRFARETSMATSTVEISVSEDGQAWYALDTIITSATEAVTFDYNDQIDARYVKIKHTGGAPVFKLETTATGIYTDILESEQLLTRNDARYENIQEIMWDDNMVQFQLTSSRGVIYYDDVVKVTDIHLQSVQQQGISVEIKQDGSWVVLTYGNQTVNWSGEEDCEGLRITLQGGEYCYFTPTSNYSIRGIKKKIINNDSYAPSEAIIRIYGQTSYPYITIGANTYGAEITVAEGQYLEIDTKNKTVRLYDEDSGTYENKFNARLDTTFNPIEVGENEVEWFATLKVDIELEKGRSQPKWN